MDFDDKPYYQSVTGAKCCTSCVVYLQIVSCRTAARHEYPISNIIDDVDDGGLFFSYCTWARIRSRATHSPNDAEL